MATEKKYKTFWDFYPYYLTEHQDPVCRELHFTGTMSLIIIFFSAISTQHWWMFALIPVVGYGFAWVGHFVFEKNKPATFQYPLYSLGSDFVMFWHILTDKIDAQLTRAREIIK